VIPVGISGMGCVCALGADLSEITAGLRTGRDGITTVRHFSTQGCRSHTAGQFPPEVGERAWGLLRRTSGWSRAAQALLTAMEEALAARPGFVPDAVVFGTTSGGMELGEDFLRKLEGRASVRLAARRLRWYPPQAPVLDCLEHFRLRAPVNIVSNACASGSNALGMGWRMIATGAARKVLVGGYDAISELVFAGFDCLQASTAERCRPFDAGRTGLALGEGAAVFLLEREGPILLAGYGAATDTHHLTQPHPSGSGPKAAMQRALSAAGITEREVDYINAHGTATPQNDACEAAAVTAVCPSVPVSSTKGATGHALGAAGAIEAAFCALAIQHQFLPPTLNFRSPDPAVALDIVAEPRAARVRTALSNSFGFGGANASLVLGRA
jgi:3-oxoacyl-[acyl-carrier-protein] synthase II